ncbi:riboflavin synthase [Tepidibacter thalassicus]|uniref:Riboflavin synthase n=1 Tax=Tepidibacter thalassicus DSM 15285 TaxID=1123350 RepID=A0A1M5NQS3_9FIRM|nr:riboflavin synthase [Tepidibacter thalassicus]SHG91882.1 riboflavin synthase alpha chain [Tepidibacter thalassicus DSM 15285]
MFTGLVEEIGTVESITKGFKSAKIIIKAKKILYDVKLGDSISTNGVCLTVTEYDNDKFCVDVMAETMRKSNLKNLKRGSKVNLERALRVGDRLGGHIVSGHIDGIGIVTSLEKEENATWISISTSSDILKYIVYKGSITIDGVSLTVSYVDDNIFKVSIIPHTKDETTLLTKNIGDEVNLECDLIGKYIEKFLLLKEDSKVKKDIDVDFLSQHGFI